jgi:NTE family protein
MRAFVLSGGGNYGALQAGALVVLLGHGIQPDMLVGVSAGALNAAWLATHPTLTGAQLLGQIWRVSAPKFFPCPSRVSMLFRLARGENSLLTNDSLQRFIRKWAPDKSTFGEFTRPRLYVVATRLADGAPRVFGDDPAEPLFDGLMASTALPPLYPPWQVDGVAYVDGGAYSELPLRVAVARGANEIFALQVSNPLGGGSGAVLRGVLAIGRQALTALIDRNAELEIQAVRNQCKVRLHLIRLWPSDDPGFWDFRRAGRLIADGRRLAEQYLAERQLKPPWHVRWRHRSHCWPVKMSWNGRSNRGRVTKDGEVAGLL